MKRLLLCLLVWSAAGICAPVHAQATDLPGVDDPKLAKAIRKAEDQPEPRFCDEIAPLWAEAVQRAKGSNSKLMLMSAHATIMCAIEKNRFDLASTLIVRTEEKYGQLPYYNRLALLLHVQLDELDLAVSRIALISKTDGGSLLGEIDPGILYQLSGKLVTAKRADLREAMWSSIMASPAFAGLNPGLRYGTASNLLNVKAEAGRLSASDSELIDLVTSSDSYAQMLADRRFTALWPVLEERAGDGLATVIYANLKRQRERLAASPDDGERLADLGLALLQAGRIEELLDLTKRFRAMKAQDYAALDEKAVWIVDFMAIALRADGQQAEGVAALERLASLKPETHPWMINFVINQALALGEDNLNQAALKALDRAAPVAEKYGSAYAKGLIAGQRACSHHRLGQEDKRNDQLAVMQTLQTKAPHAVIAFAMCADRNDLAIAWARGALANQSTRQEMINLLQPAYMRSMPSSTGDQEPHRLLAMSPDLAREFEAVARIVPQRFAPLGGQVRIQPATGKAASAQ